MRRITRFRIVQMNETIEGVLLSMSNAMYAIAMLAVAGLIWLMLETFLGWPTGQTTMLLVSMLALILSGLIGIYVLAARNNARRYAYIEPWALQVEPDNGEYLVPEVIFDRARYILNRSKSKNEKFDIREDQVKRVWRDDPIRLVRLTILPGLGAVIFLILAAMAIIYGDDGNLTFRTPSVSSPSIPTFSHSAQPTVVRSDTYSNSLFSFSPPSFAPVHPGTGLPISTPMSIGLPWWLFFWLAVLCALGAWVRSWQWLYRIHMVTQLRILRVNVAPPLIAPFMNGSWDQVDLRQLVTAGMAPTIIGDAFNFGRIQLDTAANVGDLEFNRIEYTPEPVHTLQIIESARLAIQQQPVPGQVSLGARPTLVTRAEEDSTPTGPIPIIEDTPETRPPQKRKQRRPPARRRPPGQ